MMKKKKSRPETWKKAGRKAPSRDKADLGNLSAEGAEKRDQSGVLPFTAMGLGQRILEIADGIGSKKKFAEMVNVSEAQLYRYISNQNLPNIDIALKIAEVGNVHVEWLITGNGYRDASNDVFLKDVGHNLRELDKHGWSTERISKEASVSHDEIVAYARSEKLPNLNILLKIAESTPISLDYLLTGKFLHIRTPIDEKELINYGQLQLFDPGELYKRSELADYEAVIHPIIFNKKWIKYSFKGELADLMLMHVNDASMKPILEEGDIAIIDKRFNDNLVSGGIYVIKVNRSYLIRRIKLDMKQPNFLLLENAQGNVEVIDSHGVNGTNIIVGKVIWWGHIA